MTVSANRLTFLPDPAAPPLRFEPKAGGREVALLGTIEVAEFAPSLNIFFWRCFLPMAPQMGRAASPEIARNTLRSKIEQWVEAAGLQWGKA